MMHLARPVVSLLVLLGLVLVPLADAFSRGGFVQAAAATSWASPTNLTSGGADAYAKYPAVAVDALARLHRVWIDNASGSYALRYKRLDLSSDTWSTPATLATNVAEAHPAIAVDGANRVHVAYLAAPPGAAFEVRYLLWDAAQTPTGLTPTTLSSSNPQSTTPTSWSAPTLVVDSRDRVHVAWAGYGSSGATQIVHRLRTSGTWGATVYVSSSGGRSDMPSLAAGSNGRVHLAWASENAGVWDVWVADWSDAGLWSGVRNVSNASAFAAYPALIADANAAAGDADSADNLGLVWVDNAGGGWHVRYTARTGGAWSATTDLSGNAGWLSPPALYRDDQGNRHALWSAGSSAASDVVYRGLGDTGWSAPATLPSVTPSGVAAWGPSMVVNRYGQARAFWMKQTSGGRIDLISASATVPYPALVAPSLMGPTDGATVDARPVFQWSAVSGASYYQLDVDRSPGFGSGNQVSIVTRNLAATLETPLPQATSAMTWYWRVTAVDPGGRTAVSTTRSIVVAAIPAPTVLWPPDFWLFVVPGEPITATWSTVRQATSYYLEATDVLPSVWSTNADGTFKYPVYTVTTSTTLASIGQSSPGSPPFADGRTYYWQVAGVGSSGRLPFSPVRQFSKRWSPPAPTSPLDVDGSQYNVTLQWESAPGAAGYQLEVYYHGQFPQAVYTATVAGTTRHTVPRTLPDDQYGWRVRAIDAAGNSGPWSDLGGFLKRWDDEPVRLWPPDGTEVTAPYLVWTSVPNASRYSVRIRSIGDVTPTILISDVVGRTDYAPDGSFATRMSPDADYQWRVRAIDDGPGGNLVFGPESIGYFRLISPTVLLTDVLDIQPAWSGAADATQTLPDGTQVDVYTGTVPAIVWPFVPGSLSYDVAFAFDDQLLNTYRSGTGHGEGPAAEAMKDHYHTFYPALAPFVEGFPDSDVGTGYYLFVQRTRTDGTATGYYGPGYRFNKVTPNGPTLLSPPRWDAITGTPTLEWAPLEKPERRIVTTTAGALPTHYYRVQVASDPEFTSPVLTATTDAPSLTPTSWEVPDGAYYWRVCAEEYPASGLCDRDVTHRRNWSEARPFYQIAQPVLPPQLLTPLAGGTTDLAPLFSWRPVTGAVSYDLQIASDEQFASQLDSATSLGLPGYVPAAPYRRGQLYWRVRARDARGKLSAWSAGQRLIVGPGQPTLIGPDAGAAVRPLEAAALLSWSSAPGARAYRVEVATAPDVASIRETHTTEATMVALSFLGSYQDGGTYYWRVVPVHADGTDGDPSVFRSLVLRLPTVGAIPAPTSTPTRTATPTLTPTPTPTATQTSTPVTGGSGWLPAPTSTPTVSNDRPYRLTLPAVLVGTASAGW